MRAAFNELMTLRYGSRSVVGTPGVSYLSGVPCRVVFQPEIQQGQFDFDFTSAWVTLDAVEPNGPFTSSPWLGAIFTDQLAADEVAFDSLPDFWWSLCRKERVTPYAASPYWRFLLVPLTRITPSLWPPPSPPPPAPPPPPPTPIEPGETCSDGSAVPPVGDFALSSLPSFADGFYRCAIDYGFTTRIELVEPVDPDVRLYVSRGSAGGSCCSSSPLDTLQESGSHCVSLETSDIPGDRWVFCLEVQNVNVSGDPVSVTVRLSHGDCP